MLVKVIVRIMKFIFNLGRQSEISLVELYSIFGEQNLNPLSNNFAVLESDTTPDNMEKVGGSYKLSMDPIKLEVKDWDNISNIVSEYIKDGKDPSKKITFGLSIYNKDINPKEIHKIGFQIKKKLLKDIGSCRYVENKDKELNSAQIINNKLTKGNNAEINIIFDKNNIWIAKTIFIQNITRYAARDFNRPFRDTKNGMLPPKLAQIIINIATEAKNMTVLDPFCGTGVVLQEAILMGNNVIGSDLNPKMVDYSIGNIKWLKTRFKIDQSLKKEFLVGDAQIFKWPHFDTVATETNLGAPLTNIPDSLHFDKIVKDADVLIESFLKNLSNQLDSGKRICIAIPAWKLPNNSIKTLGVVDHLRDLGYNLIEFKGLNSQELIYLRPNQVVGRQLLALTRK